MRRKERSLISSSVVRKVLSRLRGHWKAEVNGFDNKRTKGKYQKRLCQLTELKPYGWLLIHQDNKSRRSLYGWNVLLPLGAPSVFIEGGQGTLTYCPQDCTKYGEENPYLLQKLG